MLLFEGCGRDVDLKPSESVVRCTHCGYRILYKKRTDKEL